MKTSFPSLISILKQYGQYQSLKGSSPYTIKKYRGTLLYCFTICHKVDQRRTITATDIETIIYSQKWKDSTKSTYLFEIKSFLHFCLLQGISLINPKTLLVRKTIKKEAKYLSLSEIQKILAFVSDKPLHQLIILLFVTTGLRLSELCSLTKQQLNHAVSVCGLYQVNVIGKGKKLRSIFLISEVFQLCKQLFLSPSHSLLGLKPWQVHYLIQTIRQATHIKFSAHTLRHTYLSYLARSGADLYKIQKIAGHSSIQTTALYLHCSDKELAETAGLIVKNISCVV
jgi:integrase/recombinase XerD